MLANPPQGKITREARFKAALREIDAALAYQQHQPILLPDKVAFDALIEYARKEPRPARNLKLSKAL
jgi:hypothetical protein